MRTLILHLVGGETKEWETNFGDGVSEKLSGGLSRLTKQNGLFNSIEQSISSTFVWCTDKSLVNLDHVIYMEEKK